MPRHKQFTTFRKSDGPVSKICTEHCALSVCEICGAGEGTLTTDCPGKKVDYDRQQEVFETNLDYTDDRGWHLAQTADGTPTRRSPRFEDTKLLPDPPGVDPRTVVAPSTDWAKVDRTMTIQHELTLKVIAWVIADRTCEERSAMLARAEDALEQEKISFQIACRNVERCDDEYKQLARRLVDTLEQDPVIVTPTAC